MQTNLKAIIDTKPLVVLKIGGSKLLLTVELLQALKAFKAFATSKTNATIDLNYTFIEPEKAAEEFSRFFTLEDFDVLIEILSKK